MRPPSQPIGLHLARTAKAVSRAFDDALVAAGGSLPTWMILLSLKTRSLATQSELAEDVGIRDATLTHHLNAMDADGLVVRHRDPANRRIQQVTLTEAGEAAFRRMRRAAAAFDQQLRDGLSDSDLAATRRTLDRLRENLAGDRPAQSRNERTAANAAGPAER
jgi:MarR family transcriptional regulator for hemolysin